MSIKHQEYLVRKLIIRNIRLYCTITTSMSQLLGDWAYQFSYVEPELSLDWNITERETYISARKRSSSGGVHVSDI